MPSKLSTALGLGILVVAGAAMSWVLSKRKKWRAVGKLSKIYIYPLKSGKYRELTEAECTPIGLRYVIGEGKAPLRDRVFVVYNEDTMSFLSAKFNTKLLPMSVEPKDENTVILSYPEKESIEVTLHDEFGDKKIEMWQNEKIRFWDCGDDVAKWVSQAVVGKDNGYRLGYWPEKATWRRDIAYRKLEFKVFKHISNKYTGAYSDLASYHFMNETSVEDLNSRLEEANRAKTIYFRPNFIIEGAKAYEEDKWHWIKIGDAIFEKFRPCTRCLETTIDPDTGEKNPKNEPLTTLRKYRTMKMLGEDRIEPHTPVMGVFAGLYQAGQVKCGDTVYVSD